MNFSSHPLARFSPLAALLLVLPLAAAAIDPKSKWVRARTEFVEVLSDGSQKNAVEFAIQYSAFRYALAQSVGERAAQLPPSTVVLINNPREFKRLFGQPAAKTELSTVSTEVDGRAVIAQSVGTDREASLRLAFEFETTWSLRRMGYFLPVWAAQGTGKVFATVAVKRGVCLIGDADVQALDFWLNDPLPWPHFVQIHNGSPEYTDPRKLAFYHSQALALMHYLWLRDDKGAERFQQLATALRNTPDVAALEAVLGVPAKDFTTAISRYVRGAGKRREIPYDDAGLRSRVETGPALAGIVGVHVSDLLFGFGKNFEAEQELKAAQASAADTPLLQEALARQELRNREPERAAELFREAMARGSTNPRAYMISADNWLDQTSVGRDTAGAGGLLADKAIADVRRAIELSPANMEAYRILGRAFFLRPEVTDEHIAELTRGVDAGDPGGVVRYYRALLFERLRRTADAIADLRVLVNDPQTVASVRTQATQRVAQHEFNQAIEHVQRLVAERKFAEALEHARQQQQTPTGRSIPESYDKMIRWVQDAEKRAAAGR